MMASWVWAQLTLQGNTKQSCSVMSCETQLWSGCAAAHALGQAASSAVLLQPLPAQPICEAVLRFCCSY